MMPARFRCPSKVVEIDLQDFQQVSAEGNRYLLVVVDRAGKILFGHFLASKESLEVSRESTELNLTFCMPQSTRSDGGWEFTAQVVGQSCRWLNIALNHGPADFAEAKRLRSGWGSVLQEFLWIPCQKCSPQCDKYMIPACWI